MGFVYGWLGSYAVGLALLALVALATLVMTRLVVRSAIATA